MGTHTGIAYPGKAAGDLSAYEGFPITIDGNGRVAQVVSDSDESIQGILTEVRGTAVDDAVEYVIDGQTAVRVGTGGFSNGDALMISADGFILATTGKVVAARAAQDGVVDSLARAFVTLEGRLSA